MRKRKAGSVVGIRSRIAKDFAARKDLRVEEGAVLLLDSSLAFSELPSIVINSHQTLGSEAEDGS
jgi:hypothetical protein